MKKYLTAVLALILCVFSAACSGSGHRESLIVDGIDLKDAHRCSSRYMLLSGEREFSITVGDETVNVEISVVTESGSLDIEIVKEGAEPAYSGRAVPTSDFTVTLTESGQYTVRLTAKYHRGSYAFRWESDNVEV